MDDIILNSTQTNDDFGTADNTATENQAGNAGETHDNLLKREIELEQREAALIQEQCELERLKKLLETKEEVLQAREEQLNTSIEEASVRFSDAEQKQVEAIQAQKNAQIILDSAEKKAQELREQTAAITQREAAVKNAEISLDDELRELRSAFEKQQAEEKKRGEEELENLRMAGLKECEQLKNEAMQQCAQLRADAEKQLSDWRKQQSEEIKAALEAERKAHIEAASGCLAEIHAKLDALNAQSQELEETKIELKKAQDELQRKQEDVAFESKKNQAEKRRIDQLLDRLDEEAEKRANEVIGGVKSQNKSLEDQCGTLRDEITTLRSQLEAYKTFEMTIGCDPAVVQRTLQEYKTRISELTNQLSNAPSPELQTDYLDLKKRFDEVIDEKSAVERRNAELIISLRDTSQLEAEIKLREQTIDDLKKMLEHRENEIAGLHENINRLSSAAAQPILRNERLRAMFDMNPTQLPFNYRKDQSSNEIEWLEGIQRNCEKIEMVFPRRILYAFHTALKISDWSIITVLAGVSGTGKSELPRLYSDFGGINFISVPVQPNWDSQESMLGYYNSIDNRFDAQPLLQFLVQSTEVFDSGEGDMANLLSELENSGYKKMSEYMSLVLLDEMNLAHVELYFADFLSKLEFRRGKAAKYAPTIEVKLGAGIPPYNLRLSRNVLWSGTMNQDETTKSLSDKVLDRGIVINFPRPNSLKERNQHFNIDKAKKDADIAALKRETWEKWQVIKIEFRGEQYEELMKFKGIVEQINNYLAAVGRAIGHRVWQSIEFYIANYPDVIYAKKNMGEESDAAGKLTDELKKAMHIAFEDQIVQKIMPKLRGIETRGNGKTKCLDPIKALLEDPKCRFNLSEDFEQACTLGYGQFIWCSANYLNDTE